MFVMTHLPKRRVPKTLELASDKTLHFVAFFGLGLLLSFAVQNLTARRGWMAYAIPTLAFGFLYAWFDELTQPIIGRQFDVFDILYDLVGLVAGVLLYGLVQPLVSRIVCIKELR